MVKRSNSQSDRFFQLVDRVKSDYSLPDEVDSLLDTVKQMMPKLEELNHENRRLVGENIQLRQKMIDLAGIDPDDLFGLPPELVDWFDKNTDNFSNLTVRTLTHYFRIMYTLMFTGAPVYVNGNRMVRIRHIAMVKGVSEEDKIRELFEKYNLVGNVLTAYPLDDGAINYQTNLFGITASYYSNPTSDQVDRFQEKYDVELKYLYDTEGLPSELQVAVEQIGMSSYSRETMIKYLVALIKLMEESNDGFVKSSDLANSLDLSSSGVVVNKFDKYGLLDDVIEVDEGRDSSKAFFFRIRDEYF